MFEIRKFFVIPFLAFLGFIFYSETCFPQTVIVALGDSLTEGYGVDKDEAFPSLLENKLIAKGYSVKIINAGISGSTSASAPSRIKWYLRSKPDIIILSLGGNDGLRGLSTKFMKKNLGEAIEIAQSAGVKILLSGMQIPGNYGLIYTESFRKVFYELAEKYNIKMIPFLLENVGGVAALNLPDGIHPNSEGHKIIAETVVKSLEPLLAKVN